MDLIRRLRYSGYLDQIGITERDPGEVFEKLIDHLAAKHEWSASAASQSGVGYRGVEPRQVSTGSNSRRVVKRPGASPQISIAREGPGSRRNLENSNPTSARTR